MSEHHESDHGQTDEMELSAAIHRRMGTAGVRLNDAHAHLSSLRSVLEDDSEPQDEITRGELEALVYALEDANQRIAEALEFATIIAGDIHPDGNPDASGTNVPSGSEMLLNRL
jgi:adenine deaminase